MAASIWARAARTSTSTFRTISRSTRCVCAVRQPVLAAGQVTARRWASAATAEKELFALESDALTEREETPVAKSMNSEQPKFDTLKGAVSDATLEALTRTPFNLTYMSQVQAAVLPLLPGLAEPHDPSTNDAERSARDLLVRAKTGTGKTLAFLIPAVEARLKAIEAHGKQAVKDAGLVNDKALELRAKRLFARTNVGTLIISPTRELASQIASEALRLTQHHDDFQVRLFLGGSSKVQQMRAFMRGRRDIVVGTPGRLRDLLESEPEFKKSMDKCNMLILDEADTLLDMGFRDDLDAIIGCLPQAPARQTFMFSATVSTQIKQVARIALDKSHTFINCVSDDAPPVHAHVAQYHTILPSAGQQIPHILRLLAHDQLTNHKKSKSIVFFPTTKMTQLFTTLLKQLSKTCLPSGEKTRIYEMHSKRPQIQRDGTSKAFRLDMSGASILVTSDVSARGIDYPGVTRVIQVGVPSGTDHYIHRVGRTGRGEQTTGRADLVLLPWEMGFVTGQLTHIPLKALTTNELKTQVLGLAHQYDAKSNPYIRDQVVPGQTGAPVNPVWPYAPALERIPDNISSFLEKLDEDAVRDVMVSMLGYYLGRSGDLRVQRNAILQGLKDWTVDALGLSTPPYISDAFLERLGVNNSRSSRSGEQRKPRSSQQSSGGRPWEGRGSRSSEGRRSRDSYSEDGGSFGSRDRSFGSGDRSFGSGDRSFGRKDRSFGDRDRSFGDRDRSFGDKGRSFVRREQSSRSTFGTSE